MPTETEQIARILAGERELFHELIRPYERAVYLSLFSMLRNPADAEEAAQETLLKAYRNLAGFRQDAKFSTWLIAIALNEGRSRLRRKAVHPEDSLDEEVDRHTGDYTPALLTDWREVPGQALEQKELASHIHEAVGALPPLYREVFTLRDLEELDIEEIARLLGITTNTVRVRLHRARMLLQKRLTPLLKSYAPPRRRLFGRSSR